MAAKKKVAGTDAAQGGTVEIFVSLSYPYGLFHQQGSGDDVGTGDVIEDGIETGHAHTRLKHHESAQGGHQTVSINVLIDEHEFMLQTLAVEDGHDSVHIGEEKVDALPGHLGGHEAGSGVERRATGRIGDAIDPVLNLGRQTGLSLGFAQLADDLGPGTFRAFLLGNRVIRACQLSR